MDPDSTSARCPCCGSEFLPVGTLPADRLAPDTSLTLLERCEGCGTLSSVPDEPPRQGLQTVPDAYLPHRGSTGILGRLAGRSQAAKATLAGRLLPPGLIVDIGCGSGGFLEACRHAAPERRLLGIEPAAGAAALARDRGLEVITAGIEEDLPERARGAAAFTLWHVLEHLEEPRIALQTLRDGLAPGGRILLAVPNASAAERSLFGRRTVSWDPPRHRWHFTPEGLERLAASAGLRTVGRFSLLSDDLYDAVASVRWMLAPRAWVAPRSPRGIAASLAALAAGLPAGLLLASLNRADRRASLGRVLARV